MTFDVVSDAFTAASHEVMHVEHGDVPPAIPVRQPGHHDAVVRLPVAADVAGDEPVALQPGIDDERPAGLQVVAHRGQRRPQVGVGGHVADGTEEAGDDIEPAPQGERPHVPDTERHRRQLLGGRGNIGSEMSTPTRSSTWRANSTRNAPVPQPTSSNDETGPRRDTTLGDDLVRLAGVVEESVDQGHRRRRRRCRRRGLPKVPPTTNSRDRPGVRANVGAVPDQARPNSAFNSSSLASAWAIEMASFSSSSAPSGVTSRSSAFAIASDLRASIFSSIFSRDGIS